MRDADLRAVGAASLGELAWAGPGGPHATAVVPLRLGDRPAVAVPYAHAARLRPLGEVSSVALCLTDRRMSSSGWRPLVLTGRPTLVDDVDGSVFVEQLLDQEVRKHPPSRAYADTPLLRRENWWFLPRLIAEIAVDTVTEVPAREDPVHSAVLVTAGAAGLPLAEPVTVTEWDAEPVAVRSMTGSSVTGQGAAALLRQDASVPDLERWVVDLTLGRLVDGDLHVSVREPSSSLRLGRPPSLRERLRRHRELERGCRAGIAAVEQARL